MDAMASSDLGLRIRRARERLRWSQADLARAVGAGTRSVGRWERGEAVPRNAIGAIEAVLGVNLTGEEGVEPFTDPGEKALWETLLADPSMGDDERRSVMEHYRRQRAAGRPGRRAAG